jgi:hypothetical protein
MKGLKRKSIRALFAVTQFERAQEFGLCFASLEWFAHHNLLSNRAIQSQA